MITVAYHPRENLLFSRYEARVTAADVLAAAADFRRALLEVRPGFALITDLTHLTDMDADCAGAVGELMELLDEHCLATVVRVIPDPQKDIGLALISRFHQHSRVHAYTCESVEKAFASVSPSAER